MVQSGVSDVSNKLCYEKLKVVSSKTDGNWNQSGIHFSWVVSDSDMQGEAMSLNFKSTFVWKQIQQWL